MPLSDQTLRAELREIVSEANKGKKEASNKVAGVAAILAPVASLAVVWGMAATLGTSWWILVGVGLVVLVVTFIVPFGFQDTIEQRRVDRAARRFKECFTKESGDYDRALTLLKGIKSDSEVERDLLKALGWDVSFADEGAAALLGDLEKPGIDKAPKKTHAEPVIDTGMGAVETDPVPARKPEYIPLDPYTPAECMPGGTRDRPIQRKQ